MGGILGVFYFDKRPVDPMLLDRMADSIKHRGVDGIQQWINGSVGMVHLQLWTTPEAVHEKQPLVDETGTLCITLHGRVDNRDELMGLLANKGVSLRVNTDAEIILQAYRVWGEDCPQKVIGDFAFVIWDEKQQQLFCARDTSGWKPFCYYRDHERFIWASEFAPFFEVGDILLEPNEGRVGEYLASSMVSKEETLYKDILRLPPAHYMIVRSEGITLHRYWGIEDVKDIRYRTDNEYADHFRDLFKGVVRSQMRAYQRIGADLSGGLDSSSVVGMVQTLFQQGLVDDTGFETFSLVFPRLECDESFYIQEVIQKWNLNANLIDPREFDPPSSVDDVHSHHYFPVYPNGTMGYPLKKIVQNKSFRVLLTGHGGDDWFTGSNFHYADLIRQLKLVQLYRQLHDDSKVQGIVHFPRHILFRRGIVPLIPPKLFEGMRRILRKRDSIPDWITPTFAEKIHLTERNRKGMIDWRSFSSIAQGHLYSSATSGWAVHGLEMEERLTAHFCFEQRQPFHHRSIVEFGLGIPEEQRWRGDVTKYMLRHAMQEILPKAVQQRRSKAEFSILVPPDLEAQAGEGFFTSLIIEDMGWVVGDKVRELYQRMLILWNKGDSGYTSPAWTLWMIFGIELWYREIMVNRK
jgi:asparagine synthase (glutamine-hydrolysing)